MNDQEIVDRYQREGYVVVEDVIGDADLDPMRDFIASGVDKYASEQHARGDLASLYADEPFERRYAAICEEQGISPRDWGFGTFGSEFYSLYTHPGILRIVGLLLGEEVSVISSPSLRQKLPGSEIAAFPWHQDSHYFDQTEVGKMERHTEDLHMVSVWVPLVPATVENGCCWVIPGSHRWGLLDAMRGEDRNVRMSEDVEARGTPVPVPVPVGGAFFFTNLTVHASKQNTTRNCRWSVDFRYMPTPFVGRAGQSRCARRPSSSRTAASAGRRRPVRGAARGGQADLGSNGRPASANTGPAWLRDKVNLTGKSIIAGWGGAILTTRSRRQPDHSANSCS